MMIGLVAALGRTAGRALLVVGAWCVVAVVGISGSFAATRPVSFDVLPSPSTSDACEPAWLPTFGSLPGTDGPVHAFATFDDGGGDALYVGGAFTTAGGHLVHHIARWDGATWASLAGGTNGTIHSLAVFDDGSGFGPALYAAGQFTEAGGVAANNVARWNGTEWSALGSGVDGEVRALATKDDVSGAPPGLYVGGHFLNAGGVAAAHVARWDGVAWSPLGSGTDGPVHALTVYHDGDRAGPRIYAGGAFLCAGGQPASHIARWDGSSWSSLSIGVNDDVLALATFDDGSGLDLFVGGDFDLADSTPVSHVARWDGRSWSSGGPGLGDSVKAFVVLDDGSGPAIVAGGSFTVVFGTLANYISKWNGVWWEPLAFTPGTAPGPIVALASFDDGSGSGPALYAGGAFATAGSVKARNVARWSGASWSSLAGTGIDNAVYAATAFDDGTGPGLVVGGYLTVAGGVAVNHVARWDGSQWLPLGGGMSSLVLALTTFDDGSGRGAALYAGGTFTMAGGVTALFVAKWDGQSWSALGNGPGGAVRALVAFDDGSGPALYAGGSFGAGGSAGTVCVKKWDGSAWSPVGIPIWTEYSTVYALASLPQGPAGTPLLVAGGSFVAAGGIAAQCIAKWDGASWSPFGAGMDSAVIALQAFDDGSGPALIAGGYFTSADGISVNHVAQWRGRSWSDLGGGLGSTTDGDAPVRTLLAFQDWSGPGPALYAGGMFTLAGGSAANHIAKWDGATWSPLGEGVDGYVRALAGSRDPATGAVAIYAGGAFATSPAGDSYVARWQGCPLGDPADLNGDGAVGAGDLAILLGGWGLPGVGDLDGDGVVGAADLGILLAAWTG